MIDGIVLGLILLSAIFGLLRGIVSQIMALIGLVAAYFLAAPWSYRVAAVVQTGLGCSRFMAEKASIFLVGVVIYIAFRLAGFGMEKLIVNRVRELWKLNRLGGAVLGAVKSTALIAVVFCFLALVPPSIMGSWFPKLFESRTYRLAARLNPMANQGWLDQMRRFRSTVVHPKRGLKIRGDQQMGELLARHGLESALNDRRFLEALEQGDYEGLRSNEQLEKLMSDAELTSLLSRLEHEQP